MLRFGVSAGEIGEHAFEALAEGFGHAAFDFDVELAVVVFIGLGGLIVFCCIFASGPVLGWPTCMDGQIMSVADKLCPAEVA